MNKTPSIRFNGFTDDWEQRKLEEFLDVSSEKNFDGVFTRDDVLSVSGEIGIVNQIEFQGRSFAGASVLNYGVVGTGDVVYTKSPLKTNPYGIIKTNKGKPGIVSTLYAVYHTKPDAFPDFIQCYFEQDARVNNYLHPLVNKGAKNDMKVSAENALKGIVTFPKYEEQVDIAKFFAVLDHLITLHQRKYEQMSSVLRSVQEKLFAKPNAPVPEYRFAGFEGVWEIRRLGDIISPYADPVPTPHNGYERLGIRSHGKGTFCSYVDAGAELETAQMHRVAANKMIVNITFAWEHAVAVTDENDAGKLVSHRFPQFSLSEELHPRFLHYLILDERFRHHLFLASPGGAGRNRVLKIDEMLEYQMRVPKYDEQEKIANFLDSLEELTRLYAMRVEKLKNIKAACLEGMFV